MPQRTIADASSALENMAGLSDVGRNEFQAELGAATTKAIRLAEDLMDDRVNEIATIREGVLAELCAVRDGYADLAKQASLGRISAAECNKAIDALRAKQRSAESHLTRIDETLAFVETVEADPLAYADSFYAKYPLTRPTFSF